MPARVSGLLLFLESNTNYYLQLQLKTNVKKFIAYHRLMKWDFISNSTYLFLYEE